MENFDQKLWCMDVDHLHRLKDMLRNHTAQRETFTWYICLQIRGICDRWPKHLDFYKELKTI